LTDRLPSEHEEQRQFISWFRKNYEIPHGVRIFAIPNGGLRGKREAMKLKAEGVTSGVPDLFIPQWLLWIEMKRQKEGYPSQEQKDWIEYLQSIGHSAYVCNGFEAAKDLVIKLDLLSTPSR